VATWTFVCSAADWSLSTENRHQREFQRQPLRDLDVDQVWEAATDQERRVLIEELLEWVTVFPDHLEVSVVGAPPLAVAYGEVGLKESQNLVSEDRLAT
jgi:hypothetical protein